MIVTVSPTSQLPELTDILAVSAADTSFLSNVAVIIINITTNDRTHNVTFLIAFIIFSIYCCIYFISRICLFMYNISILVTSLSLLVSAAKR